MMKSPPPFLRPARWCALVLSALVFGLGNGFTAEAARKSFNIPGGGAERTLKVFSAQSGLEVVFATDAMLGVTTNPVLGDFAPQEAMSRLLAGTGLVAEQQPRTSAFTVVRRETPVPIKTAPPAAGPDAAMAETQVEMSPFEVRASSDMGYEATETLAGSRLNTQLKDVAQQVNVMTKEFMEDLAITTLDDAMQYSLNTETRYEALDVVDINNMGLNDSLFVVGSGQGGRTRGLSAPNNSHDFFDTFVRQDSYNTERFTFASGPNSILFGNSSPAGTIDTTLKRARLDKQFLEISTRANADTGSLRLSTDLNVPVSRHRLGVRIAGLTDRDKSWREPGFYDQDRLYAALTFAPTRWLTIRGYNESANYRQQPVKNTLPQDHVTPWIKAGKPLFDNGLGKTLPNAAALLLAPYNGSLRLPNAALRPILRYDAAGFLNVPIRGTDNSGLGSGFEDTTPAPNNFKRSVTDPSIYPFDRNFNGMLSQAKYRSWIRGGLVELNPLKNLFIEGGVNQEGMFSRGIEFMDGRAQELNVDPNLYLPDRVTPNSKVGQYYFEDGVGGVNNRAVKGYSRKQQARLSLSYELSFEERPGWMKWLGLHRAAVLLDRLQSTLIREDSLLTTSPFPNPPVAGTPYAFVVGGNQNSLRPGFRYYIDPTKGDYSIKLPFDPMVDGTYTQPGWVDVNGRQVYLMTFDPSGGQIGAPSVARNKVQSAAFASQSYFLGRRLVLSYAKRRDAVDIYNDPAPVSDWNFDRLVASGINWQLARHEVPVKTVKSAVLHPRPWISFAYSETGSQQVRTEVIRNPDGSIAPTGSGLGKDYGLTLRWKNWLSVRLNKYENSGLGNSSGVANAVTATATAGSLGNNFKQTVAALERSVQVNAPDFDPANPNVVPASVLSQRFAYYQQDLARVTRFNDVIGNEISGRYTILSDSVAEGYELTLTANPTSNWRISVTGAKNTASESNIGGQWWDFIRERLPVWAAPANLAGSTPSTTLNKAGIPVNVIASTTGSGNTNNFKLYADVLAAAMANWNFIRMSEDRLNNNLRKYRFTATTRYTFNRGTFKGLFAGGNYSWRSAAAVGYPVTTFSDNPFAVTGVNASAISVSDISRPYWGGALMSCDGFLGYSRRLLGGKVQWRVQLNIRNLLNRDGLLVQRTLTDGTGAVYTVQEPRSFILTNTFSF